MSESLEARRIGLAVLLATLVAACGGGGGGGGSETSASPAEGLYLGSTSQGHVINGLVLETGEYFILFGGPDIDGVVHGNASASNGSLSSSDTIVFEFDGASRTAATMSGSYQPRRSLSGSVGNGGMTTSFSAEYSNLYEQAVPLSTLAGNYAGSVPGGDLLRYTLSAQGAVSGSITDGNLSCTFQGSMTPRATGKNVYNLTVSFNGGACAAGNSTVHGYSVPVVEGGVPLLLTAGLLPGRSGAVAAFARKLSASGAPATNPPASGPVIGMPSGDTPPSSGPGAPSTGSPSTSNPGTGAPSTGTPSTGMPPAVPAGTAMTMSCPDGADFQCSGSSLIRIDNGVGLNNSGVQVYGGSTSDLMMPNPSVTSASGMALANGSGSAEIRVARSDSGVRAAAVLLRNLGLSWDGRNERPLIIETFSTTQGRMQLTPSGALTAVALPPPTDLGFYDFITLRGNATQANYANNAYFPRSDNPPRCPPDVLPCPAAESEGLRTAAGDWRSGGLRPDWASAVRLHEDGDVHAGDGLADATGSGIPFPGSKGYRSFTNWSMGYANLSTWLTQDTVLIEEWAGLGNEHNKNRRGVVAFGAVTDPAAVPASGTAVYAGMAYGWYAADSSAEPLVFRGTATATVNFATRQVTVSLRNMQTSDAMAMPVPLNYTATLAMGAQGSVESNYMNGAFGAGTSSGGFGARLFGPVTATGSSGAGPAELAGVFRIAGGGGAAALGGFIGRKQ